MLVLFTSPALDISTKLWAFLIIPGNGGSIGPLSLKKVQKSKKNCLAEYFCKSKKSFKFLH
jgi:hypothetical protein